MPSDQVTWQHRRVQRVVRRLRSRRRRFGRGGEGVRRQNSARDGACRRERYGGKTASSGHSDRRGAAHCRATCCRRAWEVAVPQRPGIARGRSMCRLVLRRRAPMAHRVHVHGRFSLRILACVDRTRVAVPRGRELDHEETYYECRSAAGALSHHERITNHVGREFPELISIRIPHGSCPAVRVLQSSPGTRKVSPAGTDSQNHQTQRSICHTPPKSP
jgi:hypothetical protein